MPKSSSFFKLVWFCAPSKCASQKNIPVLLDDDEDEDEDYDDADMMIGTCGGACVQARG